MPSLRLSPRKFKQCYGTTLQRKFSNSSSQGFDLKQYLAISEALFKVGESRYKSDKASCNVYQHFALIGTQHPVEFNGGETVREFLELSQLISEFGTPELADQMSGAMYMRGSVSEDKCSQCLRLAQTQVPKFSINDLKNSLESMTWWPTQVEGSMAVTELVKSLDHACVHQLDDLEGSQRQHDNQTKLGWGFALDLESIDRLHSLHFTLEDQFRLSHLWLSLIFQPDVHFPSRVLTSVSEFVNQSSYAVLVSFLFLLSSMNQEQVEKILSGQSRSKQQFSEEIGGKFVPGVHFFTQHELVAVYMGLARLSETAERTEIKSFLANKYGLNLP